MQKSSLILFSVCFNFYSYNFIHFVHAVFVSKKDMQISAKETNSQYKYIRPRVPSRAPRYKTLGKKPILGKVKAPFFWKDIWETHIPFAVPLR